ncbi:MAG: transposase domain-containing protein [Mangrovibacterium sp.]
MIYYLLATYKINHVEPFAWLKQTLDEIPGHKVNKQHELLPANLW